MKRNSGFIGPSNPPKATIASGVNELRDQQMSRLDNSWPDSPELLTHSFTNSYGNSVAYNQIIANEAFTVTCNFKGIPDGTTVYWNVQTTYVYHTAFNGSFVVNNNTGTFPLDTKLEGFYGTTPNKIFIRLDSTSGQLLGEIDISVPQAYITWYGGNQNEGVLNAYWQARVYNVGNRQTLGVRVNNYDNGLANAVTVNTDVNSLLGTGIRYTMTNSGSGTTRYQYITDYYNTVADFVTEGSEYLRPNISIYKSNSSTTIAANGTFSNTYTISDSSVTPSVSITESSTTVTENYSSVVFTYTDSANTSGTVYWRRKSTSSASDADLTPSSGSFSLNSSGVGTVTIQPTWDNDHPETGESFQIEFGNSDFSAIYGTSNTITITSASPPDVTTGFINFVPGGYVIDSTTSDYTGNYNVLDFVVPSTYSGSARIYIGAKVTTSTTYINDICIAGIQILNNAGTSILRADIFSSGTESYETATVATAANSGIGYPISLSTATGLAYSAIANSSTVNRWNRATSTGSSYTGMNDGISTGYETTIISAPSSSIYQVAQSGSTYYLYNECSGATQYTGMTMRSPAYSFSGGERIRVCFQIVTQSTMTGSMREDDSLYIGVA
jgi:hypothetical protein